MEKCRLMPDTDLGSVGRDEAEFNGFDRLVRRYTRCAFAIRAA